MAYYGNSLIYTACIIYKYDRFILYHTATQARTQGGGGGSMGSVEPPPPPPGDLDGSLIASVC